MKNRQSIQWGTRCLVLLALLCGNAPCFAQAHTDQSKLLSVMQTAYEDGRLIQGGHNASYIPALAQVNPQLFGIAIVTVDGHILTIGDTNTPFAIESIEKPFAYALALKDRGETAVNAAIDLNATGATFNDIRAIERSRDHRQNPYVNAGAIQITSLIKGQTRADKWQHYLSFVRALSNAPLQVDEMVYQSEMANNQHNRAIAALMRAYGHLQGNLSDAVDRYTRACSLMVNAKQLAMMGAVLANHGVQPLTKQVMIPAPIVKDVLAEMVVNGLYEHSGTWFVHTGMPAKSGVGGAVLAVVPGKLAIVVYSPPLDHAGNSVRAQAVITEMAQAMHWHVLGVVRG